MCLGSRSDSFDGDIATELVRDLFCDVSLDHEAPAGFLWTHHEHMPHSPGDGRLGDRLDGFRVAATWPQASTPPFSSAATVREAISFCSSISFLVGIRPGLGSPSDDP